MAIKPQRIMVVGCCGAGKSTLSFKLAEHFDLPLFHLDQLFWKAGWVQTEMDEWIAEHQKIIEQDEWIIDGNYKSKMKERLEQADLVIFMDLSRLQCLWGIIKRRIKYRGTTRPDMNPGCNERLDWEFTKYVWNFRRDQRPALIQHLSGYQSNKFIYRITNRKQIAVLLDEFVHK
jgi:adenylate kinase family enzyme